VQGTQVVIVFIKAPRVGTVKTRLAQKIGAAAACDAYKTLMSTVLRSIAALPNVQLRHSPDEAEAEVEHWRKPGWTTAPQGTGDLGLRLQRAFSDAFNSGASRVVIIGSDCPWLSAADIQQAWSDLETHDVVLGPARDGGYWLVALRQPLPELFEEISWSTANVLGQTVERANSRGLRVRLLRELRDVDTLEDWQLFLHSK
jgi:rSAM/selenodomain-associated transferase 1